MTEKLKPDMTVIIQNSDVATGIVGTTAPSLSRRGIKCITQKISKMALYHDLDMENLNKDGSCNLSKENSGRC